jgi:threonine synthase
LKELETMRWIDKMPRLACIQPENCSPISSAFLSGNRDISPVIHPETVAEGLAVGNPPKGHLVLNALRGSKGVGETVKDSEILEAARDLATMEGQFVEISAAASVAGAVKLIDSGVIDSGETVVCELTGTGLKSGKDHAKMARPAYQVEPTMDSLTRSLKQLEH